MSSIQWQLAVLSHTPFIFNRITPTNNNFMIIYNVTSNIEELVHEHWLIWIKEHIPQVLASGCFTKAKLTRVLVDEHQGVTYSVQYHAKNREDLERYYNNYANALRKDALQLFGDKVLSFRTELEVMDEYSVKFD